MFFLYWVLVIIFNMRTEASLHNPLQLPLPLRAHKSRLFLGCFSLALGMALALGLYRHMTRHIGPQPGTSTSTSSTSTIFRCASFRYLGLARLPGRLMGAIRSLSLWLWLVGVARTQAQTLTQTRTWLQG